MVDIIRSCYSVDMAMYADDPSRLTRVQWYYTAATKGLPFPTAFYSRNWEIGVLPQEPIGEVFASEVWHGTDPPYTIGYGGLCGSAEQWLRGAFSTDPVPPDYPATLVPICCNQPAASGQAGVAIGADGDSCCLAENTLPLFATIQGIACTAVATYALEPFTGDCNFDPSIVAACLWLTPVINLFGITCRVLVCCDPTAGPMGQPSWTFVVDPVNPSQPL